MASVGWWVVIPTSTATPTASSFREWQSDYADSCPGRLTVRHVLSKPSARSGLDHWRDGIIDKAAVEALIAEEPPYAQDAQYYICGPGGMNRAVKAALLVMDVPPERIHVESYGGTAERDDGVEGVEARAAVTLGGRTRSGRGAYLSDRRHLGGGGPHLRLTTRRGQLNRGRPRFAPDGR